jgi:hypothetical protein
MEIGEAALGCLCIAAWGPYWHVAVVVDSSLTCGHSEATNERNRHVSQRRDHANGASEQSRTVCQSRGSRPTENGEVSPRDQFIDDPVRISDKNEAEANPQHVTVILPDTGELTISAQ